jgi:hypothetical protein
MGRQKRLLSTTIILLYISLCIGCDDRHQADFLAKCQASGEKNQASNEESEILRTKDVLQTLYQRSKMGERDTKRSGLRTTVFAHLNRNTESPASALILGLITNLNTILDAVRKGKIFKAFSQDERRTLAGFTYKVGKCAVKASKYHGADEQETLKSLFSFLEGYQPDGIDKELYDAVGGYTAFDYWSDASVMVDPLRESITCFTDIMATVPVIGPTVM